MPTSSAEDIHLTLTSKHPYIGADQPEISTDIIAHTRTAALNAVLDCGAPPRDGDPLPELWHWIFFQPNIRQSELAVDGYLRSNADTPGMRPQQHMWAGGRLRCHAPLTIGQSVSRASNIVKVETKTGRRGRLTFVTTRHLFTNFGQVKIEEEQDIVYIEPHDAQAKPDIRQATPAPENCTWQRIIHPTETLLFRYSALTFNSHRIHYDYPYTTAIEGYPNLLVHGPLLATLLMNLVHQNVPQATVREFTFKAIRPTFLGHPFMICAEPSIDGKQVALWAKDHEGWLTMTATAILA